MFVGRGEAISRLKKKLLSQFTQPPMHIYAISTFIYTLFAFHWCWCEVRGNFSQFAYLRTCHSHIVVVLHLICLRCNTTEKTCKRNTSNFFLSVFLHRQRVKTRSKSERERKQFPLLHDTQKQNKSFVIDSERESKRVLDVNGRCWWNKIEVEKERRNCLELRQCRGCLGGLLVRKIFLGSIKSFIYKSRNDDGNFKFSVTFRPVKARILKEEFLTVQDTKALNTLFLKRWTLFYTNLAK